MLKNPFRSRRVVGVSADEPWHWPYRFFGRFNGKPDFYGTVYAAMGKFDKKDPEKEVDDVIRILKPEPGSHIIDWCGGWGRHAIPLAKRGFQVTLLDFCKEYLERAEKAAKQEGVKLNLVCKDFRNTPPELQADYAINMFTAGLGYIAEEAADILALTSLLLALRPKGKILIDTMSLFWIVKNWRSNNWDVSPDGKRRYLSQRRFNFWANREEATNTFQDTESKTEETRDVWLRLYSPADLSRVLRASGFQPSGLYGDLDGSEFTFDSRRVVMTAQRP